MPEARLPRDDGSLWQTRTVRRKPLSHQLAALWESYRSAIKGELPGITRRGVRNKFCCNRRKLAMTCDEQGKTLNLSSQADVFISESLTPFKKKVFGDVNKVKKKLKWKSIDLDI